MVQDINDQPNFQQRDNSVQVIKSEDKCGERLTLPEFSSGVKTALCAGNSSEIWSQIIEELVTFYSRKYPDRMKCSDDYQIVGRLMFAAYPSIGRFGTHPWVGELCYIYC